MSEQLLKLLGDVLDGVRGAGHRKDVPRGRYEIELAKSMLAGFHSNSTAEEFAVGIETYAKHAESEGDEIMKWRADRYRKQLGYVGDESDQEIAYTQLPYYDILIAILQTGLKFAQQAYDDRNFERIYFEGDHLHNVPRYLTAGNKSSLEYYLETEQPFYLERIEQHYGVRNRELAEQSFAPFWRYIMN